MLNHIRAAYVGQTAIWSSHSGFFPEGVRAAVGGGAGGVQQAGATFVTGLVQLHRGDVVVLHHVLAVAFHGVAAGALVKNSFYLAVSIGGKRVVKISGVHIVGNLQIGQVAKLVALGQVIHGNDVGHASGVEAQDEVGTNKTGSAGKHGAQQKTDAGNRHTTPINKNPQQHKNNQSDNRNGFVLSAQIGLCTLLNGTRN